MHTIYYDVEFSGEVRRQMQKWPNIGFQLNTTLLFYYSSHMDYTYEGVTRAFNSFLCVSPVSIKKGTKN